MKVIPQSFEPIHTSPTDHVANIAAAARICYKSEDKATEDETSFVNGLVKGGHNSTLEMSILHLKIRVIKVEDFIALCDSNYITITTLYQHNTYACTGSIRAWREFVLKGDSVDLSESIGNYLYQNIANVLTQNLPNVYSSHLITEFDPEELEYTDAQRHIHQGIKFITNRAVSHEFVRHRPCAFLQESQRYCAYSKGKFGGEVTFIEPTAFYDVDTQGYSIWYNACANAEDNYLNLLKGGDSAQAARNVLPNSCKTELIIYCSLAQWEHIFAMRDSTKADPAMREAIEPVVEWFSKEWLGSIDPNQMWNKSIG